MSVNLSLSRAMAQFELQARFSMVVPYLPYAFSLRPHSKPGSSP